MTKIGMRNAWFQVHKWIGLILAVLIIPVSVTGSALVWHDWLDETLNPERRVEATVTQHPAFFAAAARRALAPGETSLMDRVNVFIDTIRQDGRLLQFARKHQLDAIIVTQ